MPSLTILDQYHTTASHSLGVDALIDGYRPGDARDLYTTSQRPIVTPGQSRKSTDELQPTEGAYSRLASTKLPEQ
jgi:hypothetical protein